jgi:DNA-binding response OmpR family regulator
VTAALLLESTGFDVVDAHALERARALFEVALDGGCVADVARPLPYDELVARIGAVLRRTAPPEDVIDAGGIRIDKRTRTVTVDGARVTLAQKEYELLLKLAEAPTRVFTKDELLRDVWDFRSQGRTRTLDSHASRLRRKLAPAGTGEYVLNEWGVGYRLLAPAL